MILIIGGKPLAVCGVDDVVRVETATEVRSVGKVSQPIRIWQPCGKARRGTFHRALGVTSTNNSEPQKADCGSFLRTFSVFCREVFHHAVSFT